MGVAPSADVPCLLVLRELTQRGEVSNRKTKREPFSPAIDAGSHGIADVAVKQISLDWSKHASEGRLLK